MLNPNSDKVIEPFFLSTLLSTRNTAEHLLHHLAPQCNKAEEL